MSGWRRALLAAAAVEASAGLAAASWANALGGGRQPIPVFAACTLSVAGVIVGVGAGMAERAD